MAAVRDRRLRSARPEYAELISLGVCENGPRLLALPDVRSGGTQPKEPLHLGVSVVWPEVEVQPILERHNGVVDPKPIASMGRADRLAMSFGKGWSLKNHENNKPW